MKHRSYETGALQALRKGRAPEATSPSTFARAKYGIRPTPQHQNWQAESAMHVQHPGQKDASQCGRPPLLNNMQATLQLVFKNLNIRL